MSGTRDAVGSLSRAEVEARRLAGEPMDTIAAAAGVSPESIYRALRGWGLTTPRGGDRRSPTWRERFGTRLGGAA